MDSRQHDRRSFTAVASEHHWNVSISSSRQGAVRRPAVGNDLAARHGGRFHKRPEIVRLKRRHLPKTYAPDSFPARFGGDHDYHLVLLGFSTFPNASQERLIDFHVSRKKLSSRANHRAAQSVQTTPRRFSDWSATKRHGTKPAMGCGCDGRRSQRSPIYLGRNRHSASAGFAGPARPSRPRISDSEIPPATVAGSSSRGRILRYGTNAQIRAECRDILSPLAHFTI